MIKLLIGGSPCTYWSIAQKNNRETEPSGMGWELFKNYLIAKEKFKPDFFLYENNKSADEAIKREIRKQFGVWDCPLFFEDTGVRYIEINSALVSAQNRERFYVHNCGDVEEPEDRGILLRDILESGMGWTDKSHAMAASYDGAVAWNTLERHQRTMIAEPVIFQTPRGNNAGGCKYEKSPTMTANASWQDNNKVVEPVNITVDGKAKALRASADKDGIRNFVGNEKDKRTCVAESVCVQEQVFGRQANVNGEYDRRYEARTDGKSGSLTGTNRQNAVAEPVRVGTYPSEAKNKESKQYRIYDVNGKSTTLCGEGGGMGAKTGLYAIPKTIETALPKLCNKYGYIPEKFNAYNCAEITDKSPTLSTGSMNTSSCAISIFERTDKPVYEVRDGKITIKGKECPIKLADGFYIIRKLTVTECCRLQTLPDDYCRAVSASQAYKGLGNGWTAEVIIYILSHALKDIPRDEKILVLSMYDGIGTGRYCLDKMGFTNVEYHAYEIDKYAMQIAMSNYPDIIQHGDAFAVRNGDWKL